MLVTDKFIDIEDYSDGDESSPEVIAAAAKAIEEITGKTLYQLFANDKPAANRANFAAIKDALDNDPRQFETRLREILKTARDATVQWAEDRIKNLEPEQIINLTVDTGPPMVKALNDLLTHFWQRGRDIGFGELPEKIQQEPSVRAAKSFAWDESKHPREPTGTEKGGEFAPKDSSFGEWGATEDDLIIGYRAAGTEGTNLGKIAATEGIGPYIAKDKALAAQFGEAHAVGFPHPKNALVVKEEPLYILHESDELMKAPKKSDSAWLSANKAAIKRAKVTDSNWGAKIDSGELPRALTDILLERGHDAVHITSGGEEWVVLLSSGDKKIKLKPLPYAQYQFGPGLEPLDAMRAMTARSWLIKGIVEDAVKNAARRELMLHLQGGRTNAETIGALRQVFEPYIGDPSAIQPTGMRGPEWPAGMSPENILAAFRLENIVRTESAWALNQGRVAMGDAAGDYVVGYEYSAILDERTTVICETADGLVLKKEDPRTTALLPPNHFQCRSTVIYLTKDDAPIEFSSDAKIDRAVALIQDGFA